MSSIDDPTTQVFGRHFLSVSTGTQEYLLQEAMQCWRTRGFPYPELSDAEKEKEFAWLRAAAPSSILNGQVILHTTVGLRLANSFHPQMWHVRVHGRSPVDVFNNDEQLKRALRKAAKFWPNRRCWNAQCLRSVLRVMHRLRVSNFRPTAAKALIDRYCEPGGCVLDFSAGYGGRLLGALVLPCKYVGVDPAVAQIAGLNDAIADLLSSAIGKASVHHGCAEDILPRWSDASCSVVLTSPPYFARERYSDESTQSYLRYPTYEHWKAEFLFTVLRESYRLLGKRGHLLLNVANTGRYPVADDAELICRRYFGPPLCILQMLMPASPAKRAGGLRQHYRFEPVYVFRKW